MIRPTGMLTHPKSLEAAVEVLNRDPELSQLIGQVLQEGSIDLQTEEMEVEACWRGGNDRVIVLNQKSMGDSIEAVASQVANMVFELLNASSESCFHQLRQKATQGLINKEEYVVQIEKLEHATSLKTTTIVRRLIAEGKIAPIKVTSNYPKDFDLYFQVQQMNGHSQAIAKTYDLLCSGDCQPFRGTLASEFTQLSQKEKNPMLALLSLRRTMSEGSLEEQKVAKMNLGLNLAYFHEQKKVGVTSWDKCLAFAQEVFSEEQINECLSLVNQETSSIGNQR